MDNDLLGQMLLDMGSEPSDTRPSPSAGRKTARGPMSRPSLFSPMPPPGTVDDVDGYARGSYVPEGVPGHPNHNLAGPQGYRPSALVRGIERTAKLADKFDVGPSPQRLDPANPSVPGAVKSFGEHALRTVGRVPAAAWRMYFDTDAAVTGLMQGDSPNVVRPKEIAAGINSPLMTTLNAARGLGLLRHADQAAKGVKNQTRLPRLDSLHPVGAAVY